MVPRSPESGLGCESYDLKMKWSRLTGLFWSESVFWCFAGPRTVAEVGLYYSTRSVTVASGSCYCRKRIWVSQLKPKTELPFFYAGLGQIEFEPVTLPFFFNLSRVGFQRAGQGNTQRRHTWKISEAPTAMAREEENRGEKSDGFAASFTKRFGREDGFVYGAVLFWGGERKGGKENQLWVLCCEEKRERLRRNKDGWWRLGKEKLERENKIRTCLMEIRSNPKHKFERNQISQY